MPPGDAGGHLPRQGQEPLEIVKYFDKILHGFLTVFRPRDNLIPHSALPTPVFQNAKTVPSCAEVHLFFPMSYLVQTKRGIGQIKRDIGEIKWAIGRPLSRFPGEKPPPALPPGRARQGPSTRVGRHPERGIMGRFRGTA